MIKKCLYTNCCTAADPARWRYFKLLCVANNVTTRNGFVHKNFDCT